VEGTDTLGAERVLEFTYMSIVQFGFPKALQSEEEPRYRSVTSLLSSARTRHLFDAAFGQPETLARPGNPKAAPAGSDRSGWQAGKGGFSADWRLNRQKPYAGDSASADDRRI